MFYLSHWWHQNGDQCNDEEVTITTSTTASVSALAITEWYKNDSKLCQKEPWRKTLIYEATDRKYLKFKWRTAKCNPWTHGHVKSIRFCECVVMPVVVKWAHFFVAIDFL